VFHPGWYSFVWRHHSGASRSFWVTLASIAGFNTYSRSYTEVADSGRNPDRVWLKWKFSIKDIIRCSTVIAKSRKADPIADLIPIYKSYEETKEWIFSWLSWLAVLLVGVYTRRRQRRRRSRATWRPYSCQNEVSADQYTCYITGSNLKLISELLAILSILYLKTA